MTFVLLTKCWDYRCIPLCLTFAFCAPFNHYFLIWPLKVIGKTSLWWLTDWRVLPPRLLPEKVLGQRRRNYTKLLCVRVCRGKDRGGCCTCVNSGKGFLFPSGFPVSRFLWHDMNDCSACGFFFVSDATNFPWLPLGLFPSAHLRPVWWSFPILSFAFYVSST